MKESAVPAPQPCSTRPGSIAVSSRVAMETRLQGRREQSALPSSEKENAGCARAPCEFHKHLLERPTLRPVKLCLFNPVNG